MNERGESMKKFLTFILLLIVMILPNTVKAEEYNTKNLEGIFEEKGIDHDLSNYKETDDQVTIYLFYGSSCGYCANFINFLSDIVDDYGKYFKLVAYEVWSDSNNSDLLQDVADFTGTTASGVPYIVIGEEVYVGYSESYDDEIKDLIVSLYNSGNPYDVMEEMAKADNVNTAGVTTNATSTGAIVAWNFVFVAVATAIILIYENNKFKKLELSLENTVKKIKK